MGKRIFLIFLFCGFFFFPSCAIHHAMQGNRNEKKGNNVNDNGAVKNNSSVTPLPKMGFTVQVGAFSSLGNAVQLQTKLRSQGIEAYYYKHSDGLFKVRFGNFTKKKSAFDMASYLRSKHLIASFYIVSPEQSTVAKVKTKGLPYLRKRLVRDAHRYIGVPYKWGGVSARSGFDCSGLTLTVYRINGLRLPRNAAAQFKAGKKIRRTQLKRGDLVFFATAGGRSISHVGIYIGNGKFIHAPSRGKTVRIARLANVYWRKTYVGACAYI